MTNLAHGLLHQQELQQKIEQQQKEMYADFMQQQKVQQPQQEGVDDEIAKTVDPVETGKEEEETGQADNTEQEDEVLDPIIVEVDKRHGFDLQYELPEGVEHDSVEGIYLRDQALMQHMGQQFEDNLKAEYPQAYKMILHLQAGGTLENFERVDVLPKFEDIKENLEVQKSIFLRSLKEKGIADEDAQTLLEGKIKRNTLASDVQKYLGDTDAREKESFDKLSQQAAIREQAINQAHDTFGKALGQIYSTKVFDILTIPDAKLNESYNNFVEDVSFNENEEVFEYRVQITNENIKDLIQMKYMMDNKKDFIKNKQQAEIAGKARTIQRTQQAIQKDQGVSTKLGLTVKDLE